MENIENNQSTIKLSRATKVKLKAIADIRDRKETYEQVILELISIRSQYERMMEASHGR
jgi:hypothetical protein